MIRNVTLNDLDAICEISAKHQALMSSIDLYDRNKAWLKAHIENGSLCYVYESKSKILGFVLAEKLIANGLMLWTIAVLPEYLNKGIGIKLHRQLEKEGLKQNREWIIGYATETFEKLRGRLGYTSNSFTYTEVAKLIGSNPEQPDNLVAPQP